MGGAETGAFAIGSCATTVGVSGRGVRAGATVFLTGAIVGRVGFFDSMADTTFVDGPRGASSTVPVDAASRSAFICASISGEREHAAERAVIAKAKERRVMDIELEV